MHCAQQVGYSIAGATNFKTTIRYDGNVKLKHSTEKFYNIFELDVR